MDRLFPLILAISTACAPEPAVLSVDHDQAAPSSSLFLAVSSSEVPAGERVEFIVARATPGAEVTLVAGPTRGAGVCPPFLGGNCLDIRGPYFVVSRTLADQNGVWSFGVDVPLTAPLGTWSFQAVVSAGADSNESNVVSMDLLPRLCPTDDFEDNDVRTDAVPAPAPGQAGLWIDTADRDYYTYVVQPNHELVVSLESNPGDGNIDIAIYDDTGNDVDAAFGVQPIEQVVAVNTAAIAKTFTVEVIMRTIDACATYTLSDQVGPAPICMADALEPNTDAFLATNIAPGHYEDLTICQNFDDHDWWLIDLPVNQAVWIDLWFSHADLDLDAYLIESPQPNDLALIEQSFLIRGITTSDNESFFWHNGSGSPLTIYLVVRADNNATDNGPLLQGGSYTLDVTVTP